MTKSSAPKRPNPWLLVLAVIGFICVLAALRGIADAQTSPVPLASRVTNQAQPPCFLLLTANATVSAGPTYACVTLGPGLVLNGTVLTVAPAPPPAAAN